MTVESKPITEKAEFLQALPPGRYVSLDVFRGIAIAGMILVNNPGSWSYVYPPLLHAQWNGWTPTDLVFPFFLFIVGVAMVFSFDKHLSVEGSPFKLYPRILRRGLLLFAIGLALNLIPIDLPEGYNWFRDTFAHVRIMSVLQRIAVVYLIASFLTLHVSRRALPIWGAGILALYWIVMKTVPFPVVIDGQTVRMVGRLDEGLNLAAYVDNLILHGHTWIQGEYFHYDPEGILTTFPAVATCLAGVLAGRWIRQPIDGYRKTAELFFAGCAAVVAGYFLHIGFPINKQLWSPSYVVFTAGMACLFLACCMVLVDLKGRVRWAKPFIIFGTNALAFYVLAGLVVRVLLVVRVGPEEIRLKSWLFETIFRPALGPYNGSLAFAIAYILVWLGVMSIFYRKRIFIKL